MYFQLTAIDREGKEWDVASLDFQQKTIIIVEGWRKNGYKLMHIHQNKSWFDDDCILKEESSPAEIKVWKEQHDKK